MIKYVILGQPRTKKNNQRIVKGKGGVPFILPSKEYKEYEEVCGYYLKPLPPQPIDYAVNVKCIYYRKNRIRCDLSNLHEATDDILVKYGILADDNFNIVAGHDGSRVKIDKDNPRTEIYIEDLNE